MLALRKIIQAILTFHLLLPVAMFFHNVVSTNHRQFSPEATKGTAILVNSESQEMEKFYLKTMSNLSDPSTLSRTKVMRVTLSVSCSSSCSSWNCDSFADVSSDTALVGTSPNVSSPGNISQIPEASQEWYPTTAGSRVEEKVMA